MSIPLKHESIVFSASFSPDGTRVVTASRDATARIWDAKTGIPIGALLKHGRDVHSASFSPDGSRVVTASADTTARIWDVRSNQSLTEKNAEMLTAFVAGARLDQELGSLRFLSLAERMDCRAKLASLLDSSPDWRLSVGQALPQNPRTAPVSPRMSLTVREVTTRLIGTLRLSLVREAAVCDPGNPLLPFAYASIEAGKNNGQPANPTRATWLCEYGLKHVPADTNAADLRLAARFVSIVAATVPEQKANALLLLDRAAKLAPEDDETKALRERLK